MSQASLNVEILYESDDIYVGFLDAGGESVIVSFTSAGGAAHGRNLHEFKASLSRIGRSAIFVADKKLRWFNHEESVRVFNLVAQKVAAYRFAGALGSSMGGSAAILFSNFCPRISRILCFAPQFSIRPPFVEFDERYREIGRNIEHIWPNFAVCPIKPDCHILYGTTEWRDFIHGAMFSAANFNPFYLEGSPHEVPTYIKTLGGQLLPKLIGAFFDFSREMTPHFMPGFFAEGMLKVPVIAVRETEESIWKEKLRSVVPLPDVPENCECLSDSARADQSSIWKHARGNSTSDDASLALSGGVNGDYSFHTAFEASPWWQADLHAPCEIHEVRLFNRIDQIGFARLAARLAFELSDDGLAWRIIYEKKDDCIFGGADGRPLIWRPETPPVARWFRVRAAQPCYFHLDQVRIYGKR